MTSSDSEDHLTKIFSALAHPVRRQMLDKLKSGKATVKELAKPFDMSMPGITKHLKVLEESGLIDRSREGSWRFSHLDPEPFQEISDWLDGYREIWNDRLDRLEGYLGKLQKKDDKQNE